MREVHNSIYLDNHNFSSRETVCKDRFLVNALLQKEENCGEQNNIFKAQNGGKSYAMVQKILIERRLDIYIY